MPTLAEIREARGVVAELAVANPLLEPVFDRLDREYTMAKEGNESPLMVAAVRAREIRTLI